MTKIRGDGESSRARLLALNLEPYAQVLQGQNEREQAAIGNESSTYVEMARLAEATRNTTKATGDAWLLDNLITQLSCMTT